MKLLSETLGIEKTFFLDEAIGQSGEPVSMKSTPTVERVNKQDLEFMYRDNPVIFNSINKTVQLIMAADYKIVAKKPKVQSFFDRFIDNIGYSGGERYWEDLVETMFKSQTIFGDCWNELIYDKDGKKIVDLDSIDPKKMDYAKNSMQKIVLNKDMNPVGYTQTLPPMSMTNIEQKFKPPENVMLKSNQIYIPPNRISHFKLYTVGDGFYGIGLIEPVYKISQSKIEMERALANAIWRVGFPNIVAYVGDKDHDPRPEQVKNVWDKIKDTNYKHGFAFPHYNKIEFLQAKHPEKLQEYLSYWIDQEVTGTGLPRAIATGSGQTTSRQILAKQIFVSKLTLKDIVKRTVRGIERKIFKPISEQQKFKEVPKIEWGEIALEEVDSKVLRIVSLSKEGLLSYDSNLENYLRKMENLPEKKV